MELQLNLNTKPKLESKYTGATEFMVNQLDSNCHLFISYFRWITFHISSFQLGSIDPEKSKEFTLTVFPVKLGLVSITYLQLTDLFLKRTYEFEDIVQVFVVDDTYRDDEVFDMEKYVQYGGGNEHITIQ